MIDDGVALFDEENLLSIPEEAAKEGESEHSGCRNGGGAAKDDEGNDEDASIKPNRDCREELLNDTAQQEEADQTDGVEKHVCVLIAV
jgi:hypothetical protein